MEQFTGFDAFETYLAFKLHFSKDSYNFFKFNGKTKVNFVSFQNRKDRYFFDKIAAKIKKEEFIFKMLVEYLENPNFWIRDVVSASNKEKYLSWKGYIESFEYSFRADLGVIREYCILTNTKIQDVFSLKNQSHPLIFKMFLSGKIRIETFICIDMLLQISKEMNALSANDPIWEEKFRLMKKYYPFINKFVPEKKILKKIFLEVLSDCK